MNKKIGLWLFCIIALLTLAGCAAPAQPETPFVGASMSGAFDQEAAGQMMDFMVEVAQAGDPVGIDFRGILTAGSVRVQLVDAGGGPVFQQSIAKPGPFAVNTTLYPAPGAYTFGLAWDGPVQLAQYNLQWKPHSITVAQVSPLALLGGLGMIFVALGYSAYAALRRLGWGYLGLGALAWVITVVLKFVWAIPVNTPLYNALTGALPEPVALPIFYIYVGLLTGMTEVLLTWLVLRYTRLGQVPWGKALAFGIGFGAVEALLLGLSSTATIATALIAPDALPANAIEQLAVSNNLLWGLAPISERFFTCLVHICCNVLLFYGAMRKEGKWFWLSFIFKSAIDAVAAYAQVTGLNSLGKIWAIEAIVAVWGVLGWWGVRWIKARYPAPALLFGHERQTEAAQP